MASQMDLHCERVKMAFCLSEGQLSLFESYSKVKQYMYT